MKTTEKYRGLFGINGAVISMIVILGLVLSVMLTGAGCSVEDTIDSLMDGDDPPLPQSSFAPVSDSSVTAQAEQEIEVPRDHEDVIFANYESDYYIVVYTLNCSVLVLGKDENGKYTKTVKTFLCSTGSFETTLPRTTAYTT